MKVYEYLCIRDPRNPNCLVPDSREDPEDRPPPRVDCACDNCFYSKDPLALKIIELTTLLQEVVDTEERYAMGERVDDIDIYKIRDAIDSIQ